MVKVIDVTESDGLTIHVDRMYEYEQRRTKTPAIIVSIEALKRAVEGTEEELLKYLKEKFDAEKASYDKDGNILLRWNNG